MHPELSCEERHIGYGSGGGNGIQETRHQVRQIAKSAGRASRNAGRRGDTVGFRKAGEVYAEQLAEDPLCGPEKADAAAGAVGGCGGEPAEVY